MIIEARENIGLSRGDAASAMGMSYQQLTRIETGQRKTLDVREHKTLENFYSIEIEI